MIERAAAARRSPPGLAHLPHGRWERQRRAASPTWSAILSALTPLRAAAVRRSAGSIRRRTKNEPGDDGSCRAQKASVEGRGPARRC
jgi:hypothetical protein